MGARHLALVHAPHSAPRLGGDPPPLTLRGAPYRPGELPYALELVLARELARELNDRARRRRLPVELLMRAELDAGRTVDRLVAAGSDRDSLIRALDTAAEAFTPGVHRGGELEAYRRLLGTGEAGAHTAISAQNEVELLVPLELRVAWERDAAAAGMRVHEWAASVLAAAPEGAIDWEGAAAASGMRLSEWVYDSSRRRTASDIASPHA